MRSPGPAGAAVLAVLYVVPLLPAQVVGDSKVPHGQSVEVAEAEPFGPSGPGPDVRADELCVKVRAEADIAWQDGLLISRTGVELQHLTDVLASAEQFWPMVQGVDRELLDAWHARAVAARPVGGPPGHLGHWLYVRGASVAATEQLLARLADDPLVEYCYHRPNFHPASTSMPTMVDDIAPPTPLFHSMQACYGDAPAGTGVNWAHGIYGGRGQGVGFRMVEVDWFIGHEDLSALADTSRFLGASPQGNFGEGNHGTAGSSLLVADRNAYGLVGSCDEVDIRFLAYGQNNGLPDAIITSAASAGEGDVLMMVLMFMLGQLGPDDWVPYEFMQAEFDAVLTATSNGRIVVATVANGFRSLDDPRYLRRFDRTYRDSGAIMVGASEGPDPVRADFCNFGSIVDGNAWGRQVVAAGYGTWFYPNNDPRQAYTERYQGTSSAVPVVAGAIAGLQGAARRQLGRSFTGAEVRALLRQYGTPVGGSIGLRLDLRAIYEATGIYDGLELSTPHVEIGNAAQITLREARGNSGLAVLFASLVPDDIDMGFNRNLHLGLATLMTIDFRLLAPAGAAFTLAVPNEPALHGADLYLQGMTQPDGETLHVTNSGQFTVL